MAIILRLVAWILVVRGYLLDFFFMDLFIRMAEFQHGEKKIADLPVKGNAGITITRLIVGDDAIFDIDVLGIFGLDPVKRLLFTFAFGHMHRIMSAAL